jgi:hypothetical protein
MPIHGVIAGLGGYRGPVICLQLATPGRLTNLGGAKKAPSYRALAGSCFLGAHTLKDSQDATRSCGLLRRPWQGIGFGWLSALPSAAAPRARLRRACARLAGGRVARRLQEAVFFFAWPLPVLCSP